MSEHDPSAQQHSKAGGHVPPGLSQVIVDDDWETCRALIPAEEIGYVAAIFEAYENEFLVRTEERGLGLLRIWYPRVNRPTLERVFREFRQEFPVDMLGFAPGMDGLDEVYPE